MSNSTAPSAAAPAASFFVPVIAASVAIALVLGTRSSLGLFAGPMASATALGAAMIGLAMAMSQLAWGAAQPLVGLLARHVGTPQIVATGTLISAAAMACAAYSTSAASLMAAFLVAGAAGAAAGGAPLLMGAVAQRVPESRRALAFGVLSAGGSAGQLAIAPLAAGLIAAFGWQGAMLSLAALSLLVLPAARALGGSGNPAPRQPASSTALRAALRDRRFWLLAAGFFACGFHVSFLTGHVPNLLQMCGFSTGFAGAWLAIIGACNIAGSLMSSAIMQRVGMARLLAVLHALRALGIVALLFVEPSAEVMLAFALWMGFTYLATVPPTSGLIAQLFGAPQMAVLFGLTMALHQVGSFLGVWLGGVALEASGSYTVMWCIDAALASIAALLHLGIVAPDRARRTAWAALEEAIAAFLRRRAAMQVARGLDRAGRLDPALLRMMASGVSRA